MTDLSQCKEFLRSFNGAHDDWVDQIEKLEGLGKTVTEIISEDKIRERKMIKLKAMLGVFFIAIGISVLLWIGTKPEPIPAPDMKVCMIIIPHGHLKAGWKFFDPSERGNVSDLMRNGKAEMIELPNQTECTRYGVNQTPVTESGALAMWRRI